MSDPDNAAAIAAELRQHLRLWQDSGVRDLAAPEAGAVAARPVPSPAPAPSPVVTPVAVSPVAVPVVTTDRPDLITLETALSGCTRCRLADARTNIVFGVGNPDAQVVFVGEAPGQEEDLRGEPFVGKAGQLLTDIIEKGMKIPRASVYICNTVKCRPPDNRNPQADESTACEPFLVQQLLAIRPKVIVAMGKFAAQYLCRSEVPISRLRGNWHRYEDIDVMPTFHPAYLLRKPAAKREVWADIQQVMARLDLPEQGR